MAPLPDRREQAYAQRLNLAGGAYRPDIDGLRAIAVLAVILYHAGVPGFAGGYFGVDIFFAISGFLITGIIVRSLEAGRFDLATFCLRRIRRIVPALAVMCLLTVPVALLLMMPGHLENYGQSLFATAVSANNVLLYLTSGYFATETRFRPLFHTWSLGAEEQYYAIVPLLLVGAWRLAGKRGVFAVLAIGSGMSLAARGYLQSADGEAAFLLLPPRFWELGLGGMTALAQPRLLESIGPRGALRQALASAGLAIGVGAVFLLPGPYDLPGWQALIALIGTCALLALGSAGGSGRLLGSPPAAGLGLISYGAYLYHAPLFAFMTLASLEPPPWQRLLALVPLSLALAWLSWRLVERPFRDPRRTSKATVLAFSGLALGAMAAIGLLLHFTGGLFQWSELAKRDPQFARNQTAAYNEGPRVYQDRAFAAGDASPKLLVLGNSFARDFINMGLETGSLGQVDLSYTPLDYCEDWSPALVERIRQAAGVVFASSFNAGTVPCIGQAVDRLTRLGVGHVVVVGTKNFGTNNNAVMLLPLPQRHAYRARPREEVLDANRAARDALPAGIFVDPMEVLDRGGGKVPLFTPQGRFISEDCRHLTRAGARFVGERLFAQPGLAWLRAAADQPS